MRTRRSLSRSRRAGFALIEALIALLLIAVGLVAVSKLQTLSLFGSGDARMRTQAANIAQQQLEELRNVLKRGDLTLLDAIDANVAVVPDPGTGAATSFKVYRKITQPAGGLDQRLVQITVNWDNAQGVTQRLDLNTVLAWDDPSMQAALAISSTGPLSDLISPTGEAQRGSGEMASGSVIETKPHKTKIYRDGLMTWLTDDAGNIILALPPKDGKAQDFTTITGRVYFDPNSTASSLPAPEAVEVRLSSEGECRYDNRTSELKTDAAMNSQTYKYFTYTCYVGPGWYGNVGVNFVATKGQVGNANICVGNAAFNNGLSNGTQTSAHPITASVRHYRGFRSSSTESEYQSVGMQGGSKYGERNLTANPQRAGDGRPRPSDNPTFYDSTPAITAGSLTDYLNHDYLITNLSGQTTCKTRMSGELFKRNSGRYICITPDNDTVAADQCPSSWPLEAGTGVGVVTHTLTVTPSGTGYGNVAGGPISCGANCSVSIPANTVVVLTAAPLNSDSTFAGWSGACSGTASTCSVTMTGDMTVGAIFNSGVSSTVYALSVGKTGDGTVTSSPAGISCGAVCSSNFLSGTSVTLTATPSAGQTFNGWGGACSGGATTCTVSMTAVQSVTASFTTSAPACTLKVAGSLKDNQGSITATPSANNAATCSTTVVQGNKNYECQLTATAGTQFVLRNFYFSPGNNKSNDYDHSKTVTVSCPNSTQTLNFP